MRSPTTPRFPLILRWLIALLNAEHGVRYGVPVAVILVLLVFLVNSHLFTSTYRNNTPNNSKFVISANHVVENRFFVTLKEHCDDRKKSLECRYGDRQISIYITDDRGATQTYTYDISGQIISVTDALGVIHKYNKDSSEPKEIKFRPDGVKIYGYDKSSNRVSIDSDGAIYFNDNIGYHDDRLINDLVLHHRASYHHSEGIWGWGLWMPQQSSLITNSLPLDGVDLSYSSTMFSGESSSVQANVLQAIAQPRDWFTDTRGEQRRIQRFSTTATIRGQTVPTNLSQLTMFFRQDKPMYLISDLHCGGVEVIPNNTQRQLYTAQTQVAFRWVVRPVAEGQQACVIALSFEGIPQNGKDPASIQLFTDTLPVMVQVRPVVYGNPITLYSTIYAILAFVCGGSITWVAPRCVAWLQRIGQRQQRQRQRRRQPRAVPKTNAMRQQGGKHLRYY